MATEREAVSGIYEAAEKLRKSVETQTTAIREHAKDQPQRVKELADSLLMEHLTIPPHKAKATRQKRIKPDETTLKLEAVNG